MLKIARAANGLSGATSQKLWGRVGGFSRRMYEFPGADRKQSPSVRMRDTHAKPVKQNNLTVFLSEEFWKRNFTTRRECNVRRCGLLAR